MNYTVFKGASHTRSGLSRIDASQQVYHEQWGNLGAPYPKAPEPAKTRMFYNYAEEYSVLIFL